MLYQPKILLFFPEWHQRLDLRRGGGRKTQSEGTFGVKRFFPYVKKTALASTFNKYMPRICVAPRTLEVHGDVFAGAGGWVAEWGVGLHHVEHLRPVVRDGHVVGSDEGVEEVLRAGWPTNGAVVVNGAWQNCG